MQTLYGCLLLKRTPLGPPCWSQSCCFPAPTRQTPSSGFLCLSAVLSPPTHAHPPEGAAEFRFMSERTSEVCSIGEGVELLRPHGLYVTEPPHLGPHHHSTLKGIMALFGTGNFPLGLRQSLLSLSGFFSWSESHFPIFSLCSLLPSGTWRVCQNCQTEPETACPALPPRPV